MVRSLGMTVELVRHIEPFAKENKKYSILLNKLTENINMWSSDRGISLPNRIIKPSKLVEVYHRLLRNYESNPDQEDETILEQVTILLHIANIYITK